MSSVRRRCCVLLAIAVLVGSDSQDASAQLLDTEIRADCSVVSQGDIADSTVNVVCGWTQAQVAEVVRLAVSPTAADRAELIARLDELLPASSALRIEAVARFFAILGEKEVPSEQLANRFAEIAENHRLLLQEAATLRVADPDVQAQRDVAYAALELGEHDEARALLDEARSIVRGKRNFLAQALANQKREEAALVAELAAIERARLAYRAAADLYREAAALLPSEDTIERWDNLFFAAGALSDQGSEFGDNAALAEAIAVYEQALALAPRSDRPLDWAATQNDLGVAQKILGERESGVESLRLAVRAFELALEVKTREVVPMSWAGTQNNLGNALKALGERETSTETLRRAVSAHLLTLEEWTRERVPLLWAMSQNNLGYALQTLGERKSGTETLKHSVRAYELALEERTRERVPLDWAMTQNNLGNALQALGQRESGTETLWRAVRAFELALEERTRERVPLDWAMTQNNLGNALQALGQRESGTKNLNRGVRAFELALEERTRERAPFRWALTQENLAMARLAIGRRTGNSDELRAALATVDGALEEYRAGNAAFHIAKAKRLRADIVAALEN